MKTYTRTVRVGEKVDEIVWSYDFRQHFNNYGTDAAGRDEICAKSVHRFREIANAFAAGQNVLATTYGGWPRCGYREVLDVGMYDGWPFFVPIPSVLTNAQLGPEWHCFAFLTDYRISEKP